MKYWLMKSEPDVFSIDTLKSKGESLWDGVRNYQARNFLRQMQIGDEALFYHSNCKQIGVVQRECMDCIELFDGGANAQGLMHLGFGHGLLNGGNLAGQIWKGEVTVRIGKHSTQIKWSHMVCVGRSDARWAPSISSMRSFSWRDLSSDGNCTPTPWVRLLAALAGVIQATLPATG